MGSWLQRAFRVYPEEWRLLIWVTLIQLAMRVSSVLVNNYSQTAFLKRFGVEHLPTVFLVESIVTFLVINVVGVLMGRYRTISVFTGLLVFYGACVAAIRLMIPLDIPLLYPILFILKSQAIETLPILYWDILNDLFTTRQSKRLFTLITAGGILGTTLGSMLTGNVARWVGVDNVLWVFVAGTSLAALLNQGTERVLGAPLQPRADKRHRRRKPKLSETLAEARTFWKESPFLRYMVLLVAIPNMVLPILTYQFNVVVDITYGTEKDTLHFLGLFRGISNAFIFASLLFSGRLLSRWGIPTSLLFHPINYLLAFGALMLRFDILAAMYARFSTEVLKTTLNNPARAVLYNFFPPHMRAIVRVFLRGTVVRCSDLAGSGLLIIIKGLVPPQLLSLVAAPFVGIWILTSFLIRRNYPSMLIKVLLERQIDWKRLEQIDLKAVAQDPASLEALHAGLKDSRGEVALLCAEILALVRPPSWALWVLESLPGRSPDLQRALLATIPQDEEIAREVLPLMEQMALRADPELLGELLGTMARLAPENCSGIFRQYLDHNQSRVRVQAMAGILAGTDQQGIAQCRRLLRKLLDSGQIPEIREALEVLARSADPSFAQDLYHWAGSGDPELRSLALRGLARSCDPELLEMARQAMRDPNELVRRAAAEMMASCGEKVPVSTWVELLGDEDLEVRSWARKAVGGRAEAARELIGALASPSRRLREEALQLLDEMEAKPVEVSQFVKEQIERAYKLIVAALAVRASGEGLAAGLLSQHLLETSRGVQETVLRVISVQAGGENIQVLLRALGSAQRREVEDALEALESFLHPGVRKLLIPLLDNIPLEEKVASARRILKLPDPGRLPPQELAALLGAEQDPVTRALAVYFFGEMKPLTIQESMLKAAFQDNHPLVAEAYLWLSQTDLQSSSPGAAKPFLSVLEKADYARKVPIFSSLLVRDLLAVAGIMMERSCAPGEAVVREGEPGEALYLVVQGEFQVFKSIGGGPPVPIATIGSREFFGEMALFDHGPRSATVKAGSLGGLLLRLEGEEFHRLMAQHPAIPIAVCAELSRRMRALHEKLRSRETHGA